MQITTLKEALDHLLETKNILKEKLESKLGAGSVGNAPFHQYPDFVRELGKRTNTGMLKSTSSESGSNCYFNQSGEYLPDSGYNKRYLFLPYQWIRDINPHKFSNVDTYSSQGSTGLFDSTDKTCIAMKKSYYTSGYGDGYSDAFQVFEGIDFSNFKYLKIKGNFYDDYSSKIVTACYYTFDQPSDEHFFENQWNVLYNGEPGEFEVYIDIRELSVKHELYLCLGRNNVTTNSTIYLKIYEISLCKEEGM